MNTSSLSPMSSRKSLGFFGVPWLLFMISIYIVIPALAQARVPLFANFFVSVGIPLGFLGLASLAAYQRDRRIWTLSAFKCRFRLEPMRGVTWWWTLGLSIFMILAPGFLSFTADLIQKIAPIPATLALMLKTNPSEFMGIPLTGAWWLIPGYLAYLVINVGGEELWWRGYILPRQEASLGKWAWLLHGFFWYLFHSFFYWELIMLLPGCLALSYVAQRTRNAWPGIIAHLTNNLPTLIYIIIGVLK